MNKSLSTKGWRWVVIPVLAVALVLGAAGRAQAVEIRNTGVIAAGEVVNDDVVLFGSETRMDGTVNGTLLASGQNVVINGTVNGDVIVWTNTATINGVINGNLYAAGAGLTINAPVKGTAFLAGYTFNLGPALNVERNLFFAGYSLDAQTGSKVGTDALVTGYQYLLSGAVGQDVLADVTAFELDGRVGRNVKVHVAAPGSRRDTPAPFFFPERAMAPLAPGLRVPATASIGGQLTYTSSVNQDTAIQAVPAGGQAFVMKADTAATSTRTVVSPLANVGRSAVALMRDFLTLMALGAVALWLVPAVAQRAVDQARTRLLPAAGWGLVTFFAGYIGLFIAGVTLLIVGILLGVVTFGGLANAVLGVGLSGLGVIGAVFSLMVAYGSKLVVACLVGQLVLRGLAPHSTENRFWSLVVGVLIYVVIRDVPLIIPVVGGALGWLVGVVVTVIGLGALWLVFRDWRASRAGAAPAPVPPVL
jgi:hypothetical protein